ncbi:MAG TPA: YcaO-like family protein [Acetobacteraceae bacterium]|nr:YcaO-like family protein [Acetobacteraceae bacterium]
MNVAGFQHLLMRCADTLDGRENLSADPQVRSLLTALDYANGTPAPGDIEHRVRMLRAAATFTRLFRLPAAAAPGMAFFGAEVDPSTLPSAASDLRPMSASGAGLSFRAAFEACVGEGVELLSQCALIDDAFTSAILGAQAPSLDPAILQATQRLLGATGMDEATPIDWIGGTRARDGEPTLLPADLCLRRGSAARLPVDSPLSIGCAAAVSHSEAVLHGLLELIERDAAALWWRGGRRGRLVPADSPVAQPALSLLGAIRHGTAGRRTWLLDITTDLAVPVIAALSVDAAGAGFACGVAAHLTMAQAAEAAIRELSQMELAHEIVAAKRNEGGDAALNDADRAHLRRAHDLDVETCVLLHPLPPREPVPDIVAEDAAEGARKVTGRLLDHGIETFLLDLTRSRFGIPVVRVICPGLEKEPSRLIGSRLQSTIAHTGGVTDDGTHIPLM